MDWQIETHHDGVHALHALGVPDGVQRVVRQCVAERSALVLGSAQPISDADEQACSELDVDIVRRRSGGGAVLVEPNDIVWFDVLIPASDALWESDVGRAFHWLGNVWVNTLTSLGVADAEVHLGGLITTPWSRKICFAGLGPGEVTVEGRKVVGISQRRTRAGALFQCAVLREVRAARFASMLRLADEERAWAADSLVASVDVVSATPEQIEMAFLKCLRML